MFLWLVLALGLVLCAYLLFQCALLYKRPGPAANHAGQAHRRRSRALAPELVALEAQFFLCPGRAIAEARDILRRAGAPPDLVRNVADLPSFSRALQDVQAYLNTRSSLAGASREPQSP